MGCESDHSLGVRAELARQVDTLRQTAFDRHPVAYLGELDRLRLTARREGFGAVADCAVALERALVRAMARGDSATILRGWLDAMDDAVGCTGANPIAAEALMASVVLRLRA